MASAVAIRRAATTFYVAAALVFLFGVYVMLVFYDNTIDFGSDRIASTDFYQWVLGLSLALIMLLILLLVLYFVPKEKLGDEPVVEEEQVVDWDAVPAEADAELAQPVEEVSPSVEEVAVPAEADALAEALLVKCTNCSHEFEIPYTTQRPITYMCPSCHEDGVLEEPESILREAGYPVIDIEGIGPVYAKKLQEAGIPTTEQLRVASVDRLASQTGITKAQLEIWKAMADLIRLKGIGKQSAELLARSGVTSTKELAEETPTRLVSKIHTYLRSVDQPPTKEGVNEKRARQWIKAAREGKLDKVIADQERE